MKFSHAILAATLCLAPIAQAEDAKYTNEIVLRGVLDLGDSVNFSLSTPGGQTTHWAEVGGEFQGYELVRYDREHKQLVVAKDGQEYRVGLGAMSAPSGPSEAELAKEQAAELFQNIRFEETISKVLDSQMQVMSKSMRQQMAQMGQTDEGLMAFQEKAMAEMFKEIDWSSMQKGMEKAYAEVFTSDELRGMNEFYSTPAGQATIDKAPDLQARTIEVMMPQIMEASAAMQQKMQTYMAQRHAPASSE